MMEKESCGTQKRHNFVFRFLLTQMKIKIQQQTIFEKTTQDHETVKQN